MVHIIPVGMVPALARATQRSGWHVFTPAQSLSTLQSSSLKTGALIPAGSGSTTGSPLLEEGAGTTVGTGAELALETGAGVGETAGGCAGHPMSPTMITTAKYRIALSTDDPTRGR
jgi:hypothetical protein